MACALTLFEKLDSARQESSNEWNNAGTGHAALCQLNFIPLNSRTALLTSAGRWTLIEQFQVSRQLWSHLVEQGDLQSPEEFIRPLPHISFVFGEDHVEFLKKRFDALANHPQFQGMEFSDDREQIKEWIPLMMEGRSSEVPIAATKVDHGTDVNFGELTRQMLKNFAEKQNNVEIRYNHSVDDISQRNDGAWEVKGT